VNAFVAYPGNSSSLEDFKIWLHATPSGVVGSGQMHGLKVNATSQEGRDQVEWTQGIPSESEKGAKTTLVGCALRPNTQLPEMVH